MKEKYETNARTAFRIVVTVQNGTDIRTSSLWISKDMLRDTLKEKGVGAFRRKLRESLAEQNNWVLNEIHDIFGFIGGFVPQKKSWWRRVFGG